MKVALFLIAMLFLFGCVGIFQEDKPIIPDTKKVKVSGNDSNSGFLEFKILPGTNIDFIIGNEGASETITIDANLAGAAGDITGIFEGGNIDVNSNTGDVRIDFDDGNFTSTSHVWSGDQNYTGDVNALRTEIDDIYNSSVFNQFDGATHVFNIDSYSGGSVDLTNIVSGAIITMLIDKSLVLGSSGETNKNFYPATNEGYNLGRTTNKFLNLYLAGDTFIEGQTNTFDLNIGSGNVSNNNITYSLADFNFGNISGIVAGGNIDVNTNRNDDVRIDFDDGNFLSTDHNWTGDQNFSGQVTIDGNLVLDGTVIVDNNCGIPVSAFQAEIAGNLSATQFGGLQWSFGDGATGTNGAPQACPGLVTSIAMICVNSGTTAGRVQMALDGIAQGSSCQVGSSGIGDTVVSDTTCNLTFDANQSIGPITTTSSGSTNKCVFTFWVRYE